MDWQQNPFLWIHVPWKTIHNFDKFDANACAETLNRSKSLEWKKESSEGAMSIKYPPSRNSIITSADRAGEFSVGQFARALTDEFSTRHTKSIGDHNASDCVEKISRAIAAEFDKRRAPSICARLL